MRRSTVNLLLVVGIVLVLGVALFVGLGKGDFAGTDATATDEISAVAPDYTPWYEPVWTQPGGEIESGLFALQAGIGGAIVGFALGTFRERRRKTKAVSESVDNAAAKNPGVKNPAAENTHA